MKGPTDTRAGPKRKRRLLQRRSQELWLLEKDYHDAERMQDFAAWQREAARLALEYLRTGREIHRLAFERHMGGMLARLADKLANEGKGQP